MARLGHFGDRIESGIELLAADLCERWADEIDERRSDLRAGVERLQSRTIEGELGDMGRRRTVGLFAEFEVNDQYTLVGCDKAIETATIGQVGTPGPGQKSRQSDLGTGVGAEDRAELRRANRRENFGGERHAC